MSTIDPGSREEYLLQGVRFWTGREFHSESHDILIRKGRIQDLGPGLAERLDPGMPRHDGQGRLLVPAFHDAHLHFLGAGGNALSVPIREVGSREALISLLQTAAAEVAPGSWIVSGGWSVAQFEEHRSPDRFWLDAASSDSPMVLHQYDGHSIVVNSLALEKAGIDRNTPDPPGGQIIRDDRGEPTGLLRDAAMDPVLQQIPPPTQSDLMEWFEAATRILLRNGITAVGDMLYEPDQFDFLADISRQRHHGIRLACYYPVRKWERLAASLQDLPDSDFFRLAGLKTFCDGSLGSLTALMLEPYRGWSSRGIHDPDWLDHEGLFQTLLAADEMGLQQAIHAIGDAAVREVLDVAERLGDERGNRDRRLRIEHAQHIHPDDIQRFADLEVIASMQPAHITGDVENMDRLLPDRRSRAYPLHNLHAAGVDLALGTDWPVVDPDPIRNLHAALTHGGFNPDEGLDLATALNAYTRGAARATGREEDLGQIAPGYLADLVLLDPEFEDLAELDTPDHNLISSVILGGEEVFRRV